MTDHRPDSGLPAFPLRRTDPMAPPPGYARLRAAGPPTQVALPGGRRAWLITRHDHVRRDYRRAFSRSQIMQAETIGRLRERHGLTPDSAAAADRLDCAALPRSNQALRRYLRVG
ncbi:hypothetical protein [Nonomuraea jiangxiensis]|uniref:Cytochrome P450 n=1 Tax=Nonomuraea jiangxiensis TaxID=633440 RepID=A0A1G9NBQ3_9ACTN|nr:hypothetical protein [Nonomuraea jiangxiensis]SDL83557.1 hypothetical protein SAMN05421869_13189 [Nonomuraea jiangxiensis]